MTILIPPPLIPFVLSHPVCTTMEHQLAEIHMLRLILVAA